MRQRIVRVIRQYLETPVKFGGLITFTVCLKILDGLFG